jgi:hypothetical protein
MSLTSCVSSSRILWTGFSLFWPGPAAGAVAALPLSAAGVCGTAGAGVVPVVPGVEVLAPLVVGMAVSNVLPGVAVRLVAAALVAAAAAAFLSTAAGVITCPVTLR